MQAERIALPVSDHKPMPYTGPSRDEVLALRRQYLTPGLITYYREPLLVVEGHMQYVWDETGKQYLDALAGIVSVSVGHCHPKIVQRVRDQVGRLQHATTIYLHPTIGLLGKKLAEHMPPGSGLTVSYFTNSGSEANEVAILSAREFTGHSDVVSLRNAYHGGTQAAMSVTAQGTWKFKSNPTVGVKHATPGYCYRCPLGLTYPSCNVKCATDVEDVIRYETSGNVACFIAETIQGAGGVVTPPPEYFRIVYDIVRKYGGLCIADEVQTGFGRTGTKYWGFENWGVTPDLVTMAKGIGNGAPLGACVTRPEIGAVLKAAPPLQHLRRQPGLGDARPGDVGNHRCREHPTQGTVRRRPPQEPPLGTSRTASAHRRSPRHGTHARRRTRARPPNQRAGPDRSSRPVGTVQRPRPAHRQRRLVWQHPANQTAHVHHHGRRGFSGGLHG